MNGNGIINYKNGDLYVGEFFDGDLHGHGTFTYKNGEKYIGQWEKMKKMVKVCIFFKAGIDSKAAS